MKKGWMWILVLTVIMGIDFSLAHAEISGWTGNVTIGLGGKALNEDDWSFSDVSLEKQNELSLEGDFRMVDWPVSIAMGLSGSSAKDEVGSFDVKGTTGEFRIGVKNIWEPNETLRPFIGTGLAFIKGKVELGFSNNDQSSISYDDQGVGIWIMGGIYLTLSEFVNLGVEVGYSTAEVDYKIDYLNIDEKIDVGGGHGALIIGYHW